jgi:internalin A
MARDAAYRKAEKMIEDARRSRAKELDFRMMELTELPESLGQLTQLQMLDISHNQLELLPEWIGNLTQLKVLRFWMNPKLTSLPESFGNLVHLELLNIGHNRWTSLPELLEKLKQLQEIYLQSNLLADLPAALSQLEHLRTLNLDNNPLNPELAAAYQEGLNAVKRYLRAKAEAQIVLNEAKLILVGEGEVGKSCLLGALRGDEWEEGRSTTHGIEIKPVKVSDPSNGTEITLNGWDFGGQRVYRPTHQLFFSAPAVYLVVWKPREGPEQGFVKDWIRLVKHREPEAKILVVATHGGPGQRQPDISPQEYWELFGRSTLINFFHVESKPDEQTGERRGIAGLKDAIARVAASLPEMGRTVPARWQQAREALKQNGAPYLPLEQVLGICREHQMDEEEARLFVTISHRLGHLIYYEHDPLLQDIVILKPDWLATAISFVLDDKQTRDAHGLVSFARLSQLWDDPLRAQEFRYPPQLHPVFLRLMERFDLSYRVAGLGGEGQPEGTTSLIAQLVPDIRPDPIPGWAASAAEGDGQQVQICRIVEVGSGQSATAEGLFYQLIVRLHKFSLGRANYNESAHWQRGLMLDDDYNGRALMEHAGNDVRITVRAPYPEGFLSVLTHEVKWLVESFWAGLRCDVMVPCLVPRPDGEACAGLFEVRKLIENKRHNRPEQPCPVCNEWQNIDRLLRNAPAAQRIPAEQLLAGVAEMKGELSGVRELLIVQHRKEMGRFDEGLGRFDKLDVGIQRILSQADDAFTRLMQALTDEAKDGPRLFSFQPVDAGFLKKWTTRKFQLTLWCEHSRLPLPALNGEGDRRGVYELNLPHEWFVKAAPFFKVLTTTLSLVLPVASSATKLLMDDASYRRIEKELDLGQKSIEAVLKGGEKLGGWLGRSDAPDVEHGEAIRAQGAVLRELHALLKKQDPSFGDLVRVQNKRQEFLWVHPQFEKEY